MGGVDKVFHNLCLGLDHLGIVYHVNLPFRKLKQDDWVGVLGRGHYSLRGYERPNAVVAGIGLMTHPSEWPTLCEDYPIKRYLQHSAWANDVYRPYFGDRCGVWPVGIDTDAWAPSADDHKDIDLLVYDKVRWNHEVLEPALSAVIRDFARRRNLTVDRVIYGGYAERDYRTLLARSKGMIFLCEHESQGIAYQECLSRGVPVLAWDQGHCLDPNRFAWGQPNIKATSVPYFDDRCGERFAGSEDLDEKLSIFMGKIDASAYSPRDFIMENLTLKRCAAQFLSFFE
jgi:glycosyltransferase involved in cell wall biosynthesis